MGAGGRPGAGGRSRTRSPHPCQFARSHRCEELATQLAVVEARADRDARWRRGVLAERVAAQQSMEVALEKSQRTIEELQGQLQEAAAEKSEAEEVLLRRLERMRRLGIGLQG